MNTSKLKTYAPQARKDFIQAMKDRAAYYGLTATKIEPVVEKGDVAVIGGRSFPISAATKRNALEARIKDEGFESAMEALAYTWFNRLVAIRYMELKGYLDHGYRVLSHPEDKPTPEILQYAEHVDLPGLKKDDVIELKLDGNKESELYRKLLVAQCNALHRTMPFLFERVEDESELLLPDNLLHSDSLVRNLVNNLDAEDCESVEVLGWLYQFYIAEKKDTVMAKKSAVPTEDIPAVTQLFTPHWIVRYLVENSLGRLWLDSRPNSRLRDHMPYFIESDPGETGGDQPIASGSSPLPPDLFTPLEPKSQTQDPSCLRVSKPEEIKLLDPAVGSGHMLTYAFDLLTLIYEEEGYAPTEIPALILRHNLHGLEICPRAAQLAELALVFKAREKSRRFFQPEHLVRPRIIELRDVRFAENELRDYIRALGLGDLFNQPMLRLLHQFEEAKNFGSLIQPCLDERAIAFARRAIEAKDLGGQLFLRETHLKVLRVLEQAEALTQRYHIVVANPPYMGGRQMNSEMKRFAEDNYPDAKADLFAMFIERSFSLAVETGSTGLITMQSWMFLSTFEGLRGKLLATKTILSMAHLGPRAFDTIGGEVVQATSFVTANIFKPHRQGKFLRLTQGKSENEKATLFRETIAGSAKTPLFRACAEDFKAIPGFPIAYWISEAMRSVFTHSAPLESKSRPMKGMFTGNDGKFVRFHWEVCDLILNCDSHAESARSSEKWYPYLKGGDYRKWYGNVLNVVNFQNDGFALKSSGKHGDRNPQYYFLPCLTWSAITVSNFVVRYTEAGAIPSSGGNFIVGDPEMLLVMSGLLCSKIATEALKILNPTLNANPGDIALMPFDADAIQRIKASVMSVATRAIDLARKDWNASETSMRFRVNELVERSREFSSIAEAYASYEAMLSGRVSTMKELEEENNRLFIEAYGLQGELSPEVPNDQITLYHAERAEDIKRLLSYAIGCVMGRYSLDKPGLIYPQTANQGFDSSNYNLFRADDDGIIPLLETDWGIRDDAANRFVEFIGVAWPKEHLEENLKFIADSLGSNNGEQPRDTIRRYLATAFYKHHLPMYKKRPIYWLFSSGKQRTFQCLVYLHRYHEGTLARMRTEYVIPLQGQIAARIEQLEGDKTKATSTSHRKKLQKEQDDLKKQQTELLTFEEKLKHAADQKISLDLDDGVKVNYAKFGDLLAESKAITGGKDDE